MVTDVILVRCLWSLMLFLSGVCGHSCCFDHVLVVTAVVLVRCLWLLMLFLSSVCGH